MQRLAIVATLVLSSLAPAAEKPVKVNPGDIIHRGADRLMIYDGRQVLIRCEAQIKGGRLWLFDGRFAGEIKLIDYKGDDVAKGNYKITGKADVQYLNPPLRLEGVKLEKDDEQTDRPAPAPAAPEKPNFAPLSAVDLFKHETAKKFDGKPVRLQCTGYVRGTTLVVVSSGKQTQVELPGYKGQTYDKATSLVIEGTAEVPAGVVQVFRIKEATIRAVRGVHTRP
jgi:hypothetical protein